MGEKRCPPHLWKVRYDGNFGSDHFGELFAYCYYGGCSARLSRAEIERRLVAGEHIAELETDLSDCQSEVERPKAELDRTTRHLVEMDSIISVGGHTWFRGAFITSSGRMRMTVHWFDCHDKTLCGRSGDWGRERTGGRCKACEYKMSKLLEADDESG
jgi:hypothetical protein